MGSSDKMLVGRRDQPRDGRAREHHGGSNERDLELPSFRPISRKPLSADGPTVWRKYYSIVEGQLRMWYKNKNSVDAPVQTMEKWNLILPYIENLMSASSKIFYIDTSYYLKNELDVRLWKYGIYQFIVLLRGLPPESRLRSLSNQSYQDVIQRGLNYFKDLLISVPEVLQIDLKPVLSRLSFLRKNADEISNGENLVYRLFIALGDMYRYAYEISKLSRDGKLAKDMYIAARFCDPEKSRAYNQLGVTSKAQGDILGTIYYFTRALSAPNPADGAREQLLFVYDEIYKKFNLVRKEYWYSMSKTAEESLTRGRQSKFEIWVPPRSKLSVTPAPRVPPSIKEYFDSLPQKEVHDKFSLALGHFIGMLFTKIGTEALEDVRKEVTLCFAGLVLTSTSSLKFGFVMEVLGLLLFMTDYLTPPLGSADQGAIIQIKYMREEAVKVTLEVLMILTERMHKMMTLLDWDNPMLTTCSAALHVWCRWARRRQFICSDLLQQRKLFRRSPRRGDIEKNESIYNFLLMVNPVHSYLTTLFKRQAYILFPKVNLGSSSSCKHSLKMLPEQLVLEKFGDSLTAQDFDTSGYYHDGGFSQDKAQLYLRLVRIQKFFAKVFGEISENSFISDSSPLRVQNIYGNDFHLLKFIHESMENLQCNVEKKSGKTYRPDCNNGRIIIRRQNFEFEEKWKQGSEVSGIPMSKTYELWSDLCIRGIRTEILIEPLDVVLDTNCLIRQLDWINCLVHLLPRPLVIPSTVLLELRGLMKGARTGESARPPSDKDLSPEKQQERMIEIIEIGKQCIRALEYLEDNKNSFRLITTCGQEYKMYNFKKQKVFERRLSVLNMRNDEKILETCFQMEARNKKLRARDTPFRIHRNMLLLTGDRSLRVRAFAQDIPARDIQSFTKWLINAVSPMSSRETKGRRAP